MKRVSLTAYGTIEGAVEAMKEGVYDYLTKPFRRDDLLLRIGRALEYRNLKEENLHLREEVEKRNSFNNLIGNSEAMQEVYERYTR